MNKCAIIIPALNPTDRLVDYVNRLIEKGISQVIVVNDGSKSELLYIFKQLGKIDGCTVLSHNENQGKGRALKTAFTYTLQHFNNLIGAVTADADGQHSIDDVCEVARALEENPKKFILGVRDFTHSDVPARSLIGNRITSTIFRFLYGYNLKDTQTGLRGFSMDNLSWMVKLKGERYEFEINMLIHAKKKNLEINEVPIQTLYFENNTGSHYHPIADSLRVFWKLITGLLYYSISTICSGIIDIVFFVFLLSFLFVSFPLKSRIFLATLIARIISSVFNFYMNRGLVFRGSNTVTQSLIKYYLLCFGLIFASFTLVIIANIFLNGNLIFSKICIDTFLGIVSYKLQLQWVFKKKKMVGESL
ncbi:MAG: glycosyltransferase [Bacillota bacterium]|nr:glycosyltransferase [Bacillota bacterium]